MGATTDNSRATKCQSYFFQVALSEGFVQANEASVMERRDRWRIRAVISQGATSFGVQVTTC